MTAFIWTVVALDAISACLTAAWVGKPRTPLEPGVASIAIAIRLAFICWGLSTVLS